MTDAPLKEQGPKEKIENVVFDLGGVLVDWHPRYLYQNLFNDQASMDAFLAILRNARLSERTDSGESFEICAADILNDHPHLEDHLRAYYERFDEMIKGPIDDSVAILQDLREKGVPTYALTNWSHELFPNSRKRFAPFMDGFKGIVVSGQEKVAKPNPAIYKLLLDRYALKPERTVYIDDRQENVDTALELGLKAYLFVNPPKLRHDLDTLEFTA